MSIQDIVRLVVMVWFGVCALLDFSLLAYLFWRAEVRAAARHRPATIEPVKPWPLPTRREPGQYRCICCQELMTVFPHHCVCTGRCVNDRKES